MADKKGLGYMTGAVRQAQLGELTTMKAAFGTVCSDARWQVQYKQPIPDFSTFIHRTPAVPQAPPVSVSGCFLYNSVVVADAVAAGA